MTGKDRLAAVEAAAEDYVWRSDDSVDLDLEPSSGEEEGIITTNASTQRAAMATVEPLQPWPLRDIWDVDKLAQHALALNIPGT
ncbi:hypothetical protein O1611_g10605 [Lasiodiplodia mahajangana]|uniref:Uncharacterized protein n=1 Tax=Lasiodiplodia mahajangana TaxID=1108764 RepID=A0ACC2IWF0_9PEZI|nr:hypothetical protein O1611_g10605 [Lasiodiplodia mahajangana]